MVEGMFEGPLSSGDLGRAVPLGRAFYQRPTTDVAEDLVGKILVRASPQGKVAVRLNEVEAYLGPNDPACHTFGGRRTARVRSMWGEAGCAYVYLIYGLHHCLNVVTVGDGAGEAVLLRGASIVYGKALARTRRGPNVPEGQLSNGPGKLASALAVDREFDGQDLCSPKSGLWLADDGFSLPVDRIEKTPRIGLGHVGDAAGWLLRYCCKE